jgi:hypothetical protein
MTPARELCFRTLEAITSRYSELEEIRPNGGPFRVLKTASNPEAGAVRIWNGKRIARMVYVGLANELPTRDGSGRTMIVDSHMVFAFTPKHSAVPHFTLDSVTMGPMFAFHLDLIPRVDLGANLSYMDEVYGGPIDAAHVEAKKCEAFTPAQLSARQLAIMSPWMLANRSTPEGVAKVPVHTYLQQWARLVDNGISAASTQGLTPEDFTRRDRQNRAILFNKEVDPVWNQIEAAIGADVGEELRTLLKHQDSDR